jgi:putative DNA primase/helicase
MLTEQHRRELVQGSAIDPAVIAERGYCSLDYQHRDTLKQLGIRVYDKTAFPGLLLPMYRATGERISAQFKPATPLVFNGRSMKYVSPAGHPSTVDVHPRNRPQIRDLDQPLMITEGLKKADSLTSRGCCVVALSGVFNWRSRLGTLGDWEDVPMKGRRVIVNFDADTVVKRQVARAMVRLGEWLASKGAKPQYLVTPARWNETATKGADDFFAAGGTLDTFLAAATTTAPETETFDDTFTDSRLAETLADDVLTESFVWCKGLGWMQWTGQVWISVTEETVGEAVRQYCLRRFTRAVEQNKPKSTTGGWHSLLSGGRQRGVLLLCRGIVERDARVFDADPELLNTPGGIVDLRTGDVMPHHPMFLMTKLTKGSYRPGYTHADWIQALTAFADTDTRDWYQVRVGQAATGYRTPDGVIVFNQGTGENGKTAITSDGMVPALGDYAAPVSTKLVAGNDEHSTERAALRGQRLIIGEELTEDRALNVTMIKQIADVASITARYVHRDNFTFIASHSLFINTNYEPLVKETDHGTWRRLVMVVFPFTFRKRHETLDTPSHRAGDPGLKLRLEKGTTGQHDAIVTWVVDGARRFFELGDFPPPPASVVAASQAWRKKTDHIQAFWDEELIGEKDWCVLREELLETFNSLLERNGHRPWSQELFHSRFAAHSETARHGVEDARPRKIAKLSRPPIQNEPLSKQRPRVYTNVRFRTWKDDEREAKAEDPQPELGGMEA